jgi:hypothetical protein
LYQGFFRISTVFPLLIIIPPLLRTHLSPSPIMCDSLYQAAHYHILGP